jgi:hypothetical protein
VGDQYELPSVTYQNLCTESLAIDLESLMIAICYTTQPFKEPFKSPWCVFTDWKTAVEMFQCWLNVEKVPCLQDVRFSR